METMPIDDIIMNRMIGFFINGLNHESELISSFFKNTLLSNSSYMLVNINTILNKFKIKYIDLFCLKNNFVKKISNKYNINPDWRCNIIKELLSIRENQMSVILDQNEIKEMLYYISTDRG